MKKIFIKITGDSGKNLSQKELDKLSKTINKNTYLVFNGGIKIIQIDTENGEVKEF